MKNKIEDLRNHLFAQLERLGDDDVKSDPAQLAREIERARAVADVARVVVETAKAEVQFIQATDASHGTGFIALPEAEVAPRPRLAAGGR